jgi:hypothetical protein
MAETRTQRVRILVAIDDGGRWSAIGASTMPDDQCREWIVIDGLSNHLSYYWVEAEVPLPTTPPTIDGVATEAEPHG